MAYTDDTGHTGRGRLRGPLRGLLVAVLALAIGAGGYLLGARITGAGDGPSDGPPTAAPGSARQSAPEAEPIRVPAGTTEESGGVPVNYPHTLAGAVAAAANYLQARNVYGTPDEQRRYLERVWSRDDRAERLERSTAVSARERRALGLGLETPMPADTYRQFAARAVRITDSGRDRVELWVLGVESRSEQGAAAPDRSAVRRAVLVWQDGDWKQTGNGAGGEAPAAVRPGSSAAAEAGWRPISLPE